jgi:hypothetical protein
VLAGDGAARLDAEPHDHLAQVEDALGGAGNTLVEHDVRMKVAVAGVEDVGHLEAEAVAGLVHAA